MLVSPGYDAPRVVVRRNASDERCLGPDETAVSADRQTRTKDVRGVGYPLQK
jgi:hypothetical protein